MPHLTDQIVRLYDTVFDRAPDADGLAFWNEATHRGLTLDAMADQFITAPEFASTYGQPTNLAFVQEMYANVLDRPGEAGGVEFWTRVLDEGLADRSAIVVDFSESPEHVARMDAAAAPPASTTTSGMTPWYDTHLARKVPPTSRINGTDGADTLHGTDGDDWISGVGGDDELRGGARNDVLYGGSGNDDLWGGAGNDALIGGPGADRMWGRQHLGDAEGYDVFRFTAFGEMNGDVISGFQTGSNILDFRPLHLAFRGTGAFEATGQAQLRYEADTSPEALWRQKGVPINTVQIDGNGDGLADEQMTVTHNFLSDASFLI